MKFHDLKKRYFFIFLHILVWFVFIFVGTLNRLALNPHTEIHIVDILLIQLPSIYVFYGNNFVFRRFLYPRRYFLLIAAEIVFFFSYILLTWFDGYQIFPLVNPAIHPPPIHLGHYLIECFWVFFLYSFLALGYFFAMQTIQREKQLRLAQEKELRFEQERLIAEYAFLRSQINPHFLHNTLNFLYSKSLGYSRELSDGILTLSEIMQYSLEDLTSRNSSVLLTHEVNNLRKVLKIHQLRFSNRLNIDLSIDGNIDNIRIIPLVIITLVENALKHGDLTNPAHPVTIRLEVSGNELENRFYFYIHNRKKTGPKERGFGIGMENVKKRLAHYYYNTHSIIKKEDDEFYAIELSILMAKSKTPKIEFHDQLSDSR
jgi:two-component system LytT family sensor kinase